LKRKYLPPPTLINIIIRRFGWSPEIRIEFPFSHEFILG